MAKESPVSTGSGYPHEGMPRFQIKLIPGNKVLTIAQTRNLMSIMQQEGIYLDAPLRREWDMREMLLVDGAEVLVCRTVVDRDLAVTLPENTGLRILRTGISVPRLRLPGGRGGCPANGRVDMARDDCGRA